MTDSPDTRITAALSEDDRAFLNDYTFSYFRACTYEAVVFNDHRFGLQRLQYTANANATGNVGIFADLCARSDGCPGIHHGTFVDVCT